MEHRSLKHLGGVIAGALLITLLGGTGAGALIHSFGFTAIRVDDRAEISPSTTNSTTFVDLPGANVTVTIPNGQSRHISARFTAESQCSSSGGGGMYSVRIIAARPGGSFVELNPASGIDYGFDSDEPGAEDLSQGHAMERSTRLGAGTYSIRLQRAVTDSSITFRLDDWHFAVETRQ